MVEKFLEIQELANNFMLHFCVGKKKFLKHFQLHFHFQISVKI